MELVICGIIGLVVTTYVLLMASALQVKTALLVEQRKLIATLKEGNVLRDTMIRNLRVKLYEQDTHDEEVTRVLN